MKGRKKTNNNRRTKRRTIKSRKHQKHRKTCKKGGELFIDPWSKQTIDLDKKYEEYGDYMKKYDPNEKLKTMEEFKTDLIATFKEDADTHVGQ